MIPVAMLGEEALGVSYHGEGNLFVTMPNTKVNGDDLG